MSARGRLWATSNHPFVMARKRKTKVQVVHTQIRPDVAAVDVGAREIYAAVPPSATDQPVRAFPTFTDDLRALVRWLQSFGIKSVAMEATSVYWIPLAELLEEAGIEVCLVNPRHVKNVPGRKSDVMDCQWLQYLHSVGLLRAAFRPDAEVRSLRTLWRHRDGLVRRACWQTQHVHKALDQMNVQIHHVLSDINGETGTAIVQAILSGERDPAVLAKHRDPRVKASEDTLRKALSGDYRPDLLFCLRQAFEGYQFTRQQIADTDAELERQMRLLAPVQDAASDRPQKSVSKTGPQFNNAALLRAINGVDLCTVPGISNLTAQTVWCELGGDISAFPTIKHFTSWLGLSPDNRISGGKPLSSFTQRTNNRVARALRLAAQGLHHAKNELGDHYRRLRAKLGGKAANTAMAHKLARIIYVMLTRRVPYRPELHSASGDAQRARTLKYLTAKAKSLGLALVPDPLTSPVS